MYVHTTLTIAKKRQPLTSDEARSLFGNTVIVRRKVLQQTYVVPTSTSLVKMVLPPTGSAAMTKTVAAALNTATKNASASRLLKVATPNSRPASITVASVQQVFVAAAATTTGVRAFSSNSNDGTNNNNNQRGGGGRGFGGRGRGRGGGGGRGRGRGGPGGDGESGGGSWTRQDRSNNRNKPNFAEQFLQPAARGELNHHKSGVPKLTGRRPKGHGVRRADPLTDEEAEFMFSPNSGGGPDYEWMMDPMSGSVTGPGGGSRSGTTSPSAKRKTGTIEDGSKLEDLNPEDHADVMKFIKMYQSLATKEDIEEYYWNESDYEAAAAARAAEKQRETFDRLKSEATRDADGNFVVEVDDETFAMFEDASADVVEAQQLAIARSGNQRQERKDQDDFGFEFVIDSMGIKGSDEPPNPEEYDRVMPLKLKGPTWSDFVESMMEHPTKFGQLVFTSPHAESTREPVPDRPPRRRNPKIEFIESHGRFMYVWGLPELLAVGGDVEAQPVDITNPLHEFEIQKVVSELFDVPVDSVSVSSSTSAFVGFPSRLEQRIALEVGPQEKILNSPVHISKYEVKEDDKKSFEEDFRDRVVRLDNLPDGLNPSLIASTIFPSSKEIGAIYGAFTADDVVMLSPNSAAVRLESAEVAESAVTSTAVKERLSEIGQHRVRYNKARRNLVYTGRRTGPGGSIMERELGNELIVDGDMPTKTFYVSHANAIHLRNLDLSVTKEEISAFFQPFCSMPRDVDGSIEFVTCYEGLPTGRAYVGFDEHGELEAAMKLCQSSGRIEGLGSTKVVMKKVNDLHKVFREKRSARDEAELLDSLDNWEQYANQDDLEYLYDNGVSKEALDEVFREIRYQNPTFAALDQAMRSETINPEVEAGGMYRQLVERYVALLKECQSTPEDPGPIYESLFSPAEEIDTEELFDDESIRQAELRKRREVP